jgi:hypothetical protein
LANEVFQIFRRQRNHLKCVAVPVQDSGICTCHRLTSPLELRPRGDPTTSVDGATSLLLAAITAYCPSVQSIETAGPLTNYFQ